MPQKVPPRVVASVVRPPRAGPPFDLSLQLGRRELHVLRGGADGLAVRMLPVRGGVRIDVIACGDPGREELDAALTTAAGLAGLDDDPGDFPDLVRRHPVVERLWRAFPGARLPRAATVWEAFASAVVEQLVTFAEARQSLAAMRHRHGLILPGLGLRAFPAAPAIAAVGTPMLRSLGIGLRRATTLLRGARLVDRLERLRGCPIPEAMRWLDALPGVGPWTANKVAIEALGHADGVLVGDAGAPFVTTMALTGTAGGDDEMVAALEPFRPHRARVLRLFMLAELRHGGVPGVPPRRAPIQTPHRLRPWAT